jgi:hypothetical protein
MSMPNPDALIARHALARARHATTIVAGGQRQGVRGSNQPCPSIKLSARSNNHAAAIDERCHVLSDTNTVYPGTGELRYGIKFRQ